MTIPEKRRRLDDRLRQRLQNFSHLYQEWCHRILQPEPSAHLVQELNIHIMVRYKTIKKHLFKSVTRSTNLPIELHHDAIQHEANVVVVLQQRHNGGLTQLEFETLYDRLLDDCTHALMSILKPKTVESALRKMLQN